MLVVHLHRCRPVRGTGRTAGAAAAAVDLRRIVPHVCACVHPTPHQTMSKPQSGPCVRRHSTNPPPESEQYLRGLCAGVGPPTHPPTNKAPVRVTLRHASLSGKQTKRTALEHALSQHASCCQRCVEPQPLRSHRVASNEITRHTYVPAAYQGNIADGACKHTHSGQSSAYREASSWPHPTPHNKKRTEQHTQPGIVGSIHNTTTPPNAHAHTHNPGTGVLHR